MFENLRQGFPCPIEHTQRFLPEKIHDSAPLSQVRYHKGEFTRSRKTSGFPAIKYAETTITEENSCQAQGQEAAGRNAG